MERIDRCRGSHPVGALIDLCGGTMGAFLVYLTTVSHENQNFPNTLDVAYIRLNHYETPITGDHHDIKATAAHKRKRVEDKKEN